MYEFWDGYVKNQNTEKKQNYVTWTKFFGLMKDELSRNIMREFAALRAKRYSNLTKNSSEDKKSEDTKKCVIKKI